MLCVHRLATKRVCILQGHCAHLLQLWHALDRDRGAANRCYVLETEVRGELIAGFDGLGSTDLRSVRNEHR